MCETASQRVKREREKKGYTKAYMAKSLNMSTDEYSKLEQSETIKGSQIVKIGEILNVNPEYLSNGEESELNFYLKQPISTANKAYKEIILFAMEKLPIKDQKDIYKYVLDKLYKL